MTPQTIHIIAISGSLRKESSNTAILHALHKLLPPGIQFNIYKGIGNLPHFNPELDQDAALPAVQAFRDELKAADGIIICTPEYAHGVPGALKNALDWVVSSGEFVNKPSMAISASPGYGGGEKALASLVQTLTVMTAELVSDLSIPFIRTKMTGDMPDEETTEKFRSELNKLLGAISAHKNNPE